MTRTVIDQIEQEFYFQFSCENFESKRTMYLCNVRHCKQGETETFINKISSLLVVSQHAVGPLSDRRLVIANNNPTLYSIIIICERKSVSWEISCIKSRPQTNDIMCNCELAKPWPSHGYWEREGWNMSFTWPGRSRSSKYFAHAVLEPSEVVRRSVNGRPQYLREVFCSCQIKKKRKNWENIKCKSVRHNWRYERYACA